MIIGMGTDLIAVQRIKKIYQRHPQRFLERTYHPEEQAYCLKAKDPAERLAARWAAKEAVMKALGTGWAQGIQFPHIAILHTESGAPCVQLFHQTAMYAEQQHIKQWWISMSHADGFAIATAIAEG